MSDKQLDDIIYELDSIHELIADLTERVEILEALYRASSSDFAEFSALGLFFVCLVLLSIIFRMREDSDRTGCGSL